MTKNPFKVGDIVTFHEPGNNDDILTLDRSYEVLETRDGYQYGRSRFGFIVILDDRHMEVTKFSDKFTLRPTTKLPEDLFTI